MKMFDLIKKSNSVSKLLDKLLKDEVVWCKEIDSEVVTLTIEEFDFIKSKLVQLIESEKEKKCKLLVRGESILELARKLNSSHFSKVFSIGEKAQNYLKNMHINRDAFNMINDVSQKTMEWIFDQFAEIQLRKDDFQRFFQKLDNKLEFAKKLTNNERYRDYYLYGLQTEGGSKRKVFFVSSSISPEKALYDDKNKVLFLFWIPEPHIDYSQSKCSLKQISNEIRANRLPILKGSYFPEEKEYSIKGAIFPDFIYAIIDVDNEKIIISHKLLSDKSNWIEDGFDIHSDQFVNDFNDSTYKKYVSRYKTKEYVDS